MSAFQKDMQPVRHIATATISTLALCGAGACWPNPTVFGTDEQPATCRYCHRLQISSNQGERDD